MVDKILGILVLVYVPPAWSFGPENHPLVNMEQMNLITGLFRGCDLFVINVNVELANHDHIQEPLTYYSDEFKFNDHFDNHQFFNLALGTRFWTSFHHNRSALLPKWTIQKSRNCKAQILLSKSLILRNINVFQVHESTPVYITFVHIMSIRVSSNTAVNVNTVMKTAQFLRTQLKKGSMTSKYRNSRHLYYVICPFTTQQPQNEQSPVGLRVSVKASKEFFIFSACNYCKPTTDSMLLLATHADRVFAQRASQVAYDNVNSFHTDSTVHDRSLGRARVRFFYVTFEKGNLPHVKTMESVLASFTLCQKKRGERRIIESMEFSPEQLLILILGQKFTNMTFIWPSERNHELYTTTGSSFLQEHIIGPGYTAMATGYHASNVIPTERIALFFITSDNVTSVLKETAVFSAPFDRAIWILILASTVTTATVLFIASRNDRCVTRSLEVFIMVWRILLENFYDVAPAAKVNARVFAVLTFTIAVVGIVLSNGYKGVLTSNLSMPMTYAGPVSLKALKEENWTLVPYFYSKQYEKNPAMKLLLQPALYHAKSYVYLRQFYELSVDIFASREELDIPVSVLLDAVMRCELKKAAFWILAADRGQPSAINLPRICAQQLRNKAFVLGERSYAPGRVGWATIMTQHQGIVFRAIRTLVETGVSNRLEALLRKGNDAFQVKNRVIEPLNPKVEPLILANPLISSAFNLWWNVIITASVIAVLELFAGMCRSLLTLAA